jgi:two-component system NarL family response regulator
VDEPNPISVTAERRIVAALRNRVTNKQGGGPAPKPPAQRSPKPADRGGDPIRVLLVDDHALLRRGLVTVLSLESDIEVVGEAGDGREAVVKVAELLPDVVLLDVKMPSRGEIGGGIEAAAAIRTIAPSTRVVMLTMSDDEADLYEAVKAGATGYLLKDIPLDEVAESLRAVAEGQSLITPSMATKLLSEFATLAKSGQEREQAPAPPKLTDRELEVLKLIATGANNGKIAKTLFISENTVKNHVRNILEKLHLHSRMEAVMYAVREKILDLPGEEEHDPPR